MRSAKAILFRRSFCRDSSNPIPILDASLSFKYLFDLMKSTRKVLAKFIDALKSLISVIRHMFNSAHDSIFQHPKISPINFSLTFIPTPLIASLSPSVPHLNPINLLLKQKEFSVNLLHPPLNGKLRRRRFRTEKREFFHC